MNYILITMFSGFDVNQLLNGEGGFMPFEGCRIKT